MKNKNLVSESKLDDERIRYIRFRYFELFDANEIVDELKYFKSEKLNGT
jgi:hypothetical protein